MLKYTKRNSLTLKSPPLLHDISKDWNSNSTNLSGSATMYKPHTWSPVPGEIKEKIPSSDFTYMHSKILIKK